MTTSSIQKKTIFEIDLKREVNSNTLPLIGFAGDSQRLWLTSSEVEVMEGLQRELQAKEESVEALRARVVGLEKEVTNRERQMDMMRQSLRILSNDKPGQTPRRSHSRSLYWRKSRARK